MAAPTTTHSVTVRKLSSTITSLWAKLKNTFAPKTDNGSTGTTKFYREDGTWAVPPGSGAVSGVKGGAESSYRTGQVNLTPANIGTIPGKYIWSGGSNAVYGYKIGESVEITSNGVYCMAMGTLVCTNKFTTDPQTGRDGALFMGFFYIWFYKDSGSWTGRMRLFSCNPSLSNTDTYLYHNENRNKVEFFIGFTDNYSSKTMNSKRAVGVGICYNFAQNFNIPASLAEVAQNQPFTEAWSIYKQPYYGQTSEGIGSSVKPVYINANGNTVPCARKLVSTIVANGTPYNLYGAISNYEDYEVVNVLNKTGSNMVVNVSSSSSDNVTISNNRYCSFVKYGSRFYRDS